MTDYRAELNDEQYRVVTEGDGRALNDSHRYDIIII